MKTTVSVDVAKPADTVFDLMADARNEPTWNSQVSRTDLESGEPIGAGSRFTTVNRGQPYTAVITEYDRPNHLVYEVTGKAMTITGDLTFAGEGSGTRVDASFDMRPKGSMKVMMPLMAPAIRRDFPKQFASFKQFCESR
jgi:uncharacterized protein YndB with AHSA1/START domain